MKPRHFELDGRAVSVNLHRSQGELLRSRSFQGRGRPLAGNFACWDNLGELLSSNWFENDALPALLQAREDARGSKTFTVELDHPNLIGWTSIATANDPAYLCHWTEDDEEHVGMVDVGVIELTKVKFTRKLTGLVPDVPAPMTHKVTFIAQSFIRRGTLVIILLNARPGIAMPEDIISAMKHRRGAFIDDEWGIHFWEFGSRGDNPADPLWTYGRHVDNDKRVHLLTGEELPPDKVDWYYDDDEDENESQRAAG